MEGSVEQSGIIASKNFVWRGGEVEKGVAGDLIIQNCSLRQPEKMKIL